MERETGRLARIVNPGGTPPKIISGGRSMAQQASKNGSRGRGRGKSGGGGSSSSRGRSQTSRRGGGSSSSRGRGRSSARNGGQKVVYRYRTAPQAKNPGRRKGRRSRRRSRNPFVGGIGNILKELGYGGAGAFGVATLSQMIPIQLTSPFMILIVQGVVAWIVGWLGGKLFGKQNENTIRVGGFAYAAGNFVANQFPNLQQTILSFSPIKGAAHARPTAVATQAAASQLPQGDSGTSMTDVVMSADELNDISVQRPGSYGYMGDIGVVRSGAFGAR